MSTPSLWCSLCIELAYKDDLPTQISKADVMRTWLSRAGSRPLRLYYADNRLVEDIVHDGADTIRILTEYLPRCQVLHFHAISAEVLGSVSFAHLEALDISSVFRIPRTFLAWTPRIRKMKVSWAHLCDLDLARMPWAQLEELDVLAIHRPRACIELLGRCTSLRKCSLRYNSKWGEQPEADTDRRVHLPELESLTLSSHVSSNTDVVVDSILAPKLKHVAVNCQVGTAGTYEQWEGMLRAGDVALESLELHTRGCPFDSFDDLLRVLALMGSLRRLSITGPDESDPFATRTDDFMHAMTVTGGEKPPLLSRLEDLEVSVTSERFSAPLVARMLLSRVKAGMGVVPLRRADVRLRCTEFEYEGWRWTVTEGRVVEEPIDWALWEEYDR